MWRKLYARRDNVCKPFVLGFDLCIMKYHVKNAAFARKQPAFFFVPFLSCRSRVI